MKLIISLCLMIISLLSQAQPLLIGTTLDDPPFASAADNKGHFYGFEIDLMIEVCKRMNMECNFKAIIVSNAINLLNTQKIDLVVAAIIAPPAGSPDAANFIFSRPYLPSRGQFIAKQNSKIINLEMIRNKVVGVRLGSLFGGTLFENFILGLYNNQLKVKVYLTMNELLNALENGTVEAVFSNSEPIHFWYMNLKGAFKLIGKPISIGGGYSIMGRRMQIDLMNQINAALSAMVADGTYTQLYKKYFIL